MPIALVDRSDIFVSIECPSTAELITLLNTFFYVSSHHINTLCLCQFTILSWLCLGHLLHALLVGPIQAISVEYLPAVSLLRLFIPLALPTSLLLLSLNSRLKQVALALVDAFSLKVTLSHSLLNEEFLFRFLPFVVRISHSLLFL